VAIDAFQNSWNPSKCRPLEERSRRSTSIERPSKKVRHDSMTSSTSNKENLVKSGSAKESPSIAGHVRATSLNMQQCKKIAKTSKVSPRQPQKSHTYSVLDYRISHPDLNRSWPENMYNPNTPDSPRSNKSDFKKRTYTSLPPSEGERERTKSSTTHLSDGNSSRSSTLQHYRKSQDNFTQASSKTYTHASSLKKKRGWNEHLNLGIQKQFGLVTDQEFEESKRALTGTVISKDARPTRSFKRKKKGKELLFQGRKFVKEIPDWSIILPEKVIRYRYDPSKEIWLQELRKVKIAPSPFAYGSQRMVFYMRDVTEGDKKDNNYVGFVAKMISPLIEERAAYFKDVAMQTHAQRFSELFNACGVVKKVAFLDCWVIEFSMRPHIEHYEPPGPQLMAVERYLDGKYMKHNNNLDWTENILARNTPQAFSHFTYEVSNQEILVCDVQGVNDIYTDPQFHTKRGIDDPRFGTGNLGTFGIAGFFRKHRCNQICLYLKLKRRNKIDPKLLDGTIPNSMYMKHDSIATYSVKDSHIRSVPRPGGKLTYDATVLAESARRPLLPGFKKGHNLDSENTRCCCVIL